MGVVGSREKLTGSSSSLTQGMLRASQGMLFAESTALETPHRDLYRMGSDDFEIRYRTFARSPVALVCALANSPENIWFVPAEGSSPDAAAACIGRCCNET